MSYFFLVASGNYCPGSWCFLVLIVSGNILFLGFMQLDLIEPVLLPR